MGIFSDMMNRLTTEAEAAEFVEPMPEEDFKEEPAQTQVPISLDKLAIATAALSIYTAACDGKITLDEFFEVELGIGAINAKAPISDEANAVIKQITTNHNITWDEVKNYLDNIRLEDLVAMKRVLTDIVLSSNGVEEAEKKVMDDFDAYIEERSN